MNTKLFSILVVAMAFTMILGTGVIKAAAANSDSYNFSYTRPDSFGVDEAGNRAGSVDMDRGATPVFHSYGLQGNWSEAK